MWGIVLAFISFIALFGAIAWAMRVAFDQQDYFDMEYDKYQDDEEDEHANL